MKKLLIAILCGIALGIFLYVIADKVTYPHQAAVEVSGDAQVSYTRWILKELSLEEDKQTYGVGIEIMSVYSYDVCLDWNNMCYDWLTITVTVSLDAVRSSFQVCDIYFGWFDDD